MFLTHELVGKWRTIGGRERGMINNCRCQCDIRIPEVGGCPAIGPFEKSTHNIKPLLYLLISTVPEFKYLKTMSERKQRGSGRRIIKVSLDAVFPTNN